MHDLGIGKLITGDAQRDAIHIAVAPVVAGADLRVGGLVRLNESGEAVPTYYDSSDIGIVDPFLRVDVKKGMRVWVFMYPPEGG